MKRSHEFISPIPKEINKRVRVAQSGYNNYAPAAGNSMSYGASNNDAYSQPFSNQYMSQQMQMGSSMAMVGMNNLGGQYSNPNAMGNHFQHNGAPEAMGGYGQNSYGQMGQFHQAAGAQQFGGNQNNQMRTIYIGNLPPGTPMEEVMSHVKGGIVEQVKILEDKNCAFITFVEASSAFNFMNESQSKRITFNGQDAKIGFGKPSPCPPMIQTAVSNGATRNVFIGSVDDSMTDTFLLAELSKFGAVDQVKILAEKRIAFVHMASIKDALTAVMSLQSDQKFRGRRIHYGKDRCAYNNQPVLGMAPAAFGGNFMDSSMGTQNRTVYLGGIHAEATTKDLCDVIRGGILQMIKYMPDKNYAFVTFVDPSAALALVNRGNHEGVVIKGKRVKVAWGKPSALPMNVATVVQGGASRNVYIGNTDAGISEEKLRKDFGEYGEIELINLIPDRNIGFVNFTDILSAVRAVEGIKTNPEYAAYKVSYGKDRCGNPPRPRPEGAGAHPSGSGGQIPTAGATNATGALPSSAVVILPSVSDNGIPDDNMNMY
ncbi:hypothetical protein HDU97_009076 [Phlyctochytrium planicorne]|nr:hypothetical protein HDU97_009076 [Phlyctochytrium planicorne]